MSTRFATKTLFVSLSAVAAFANVAIAAPASAADFDSRSMIVRYADLDLTSASGAARLERRIADAAGEVCGSVDQRSLDQVGQVRTCRTAAIASAEPQVKLVLALADKGERFADAGGINVTAN